MVLNNAKIHMEFPNDAVIPNINDMRLLEHSDLDI